MLAARDEDRASAAMWHSSPTALALLANVGAAYLVGTVRDIEAIVPTFFVSDVRRASEWYARVLGFQVAFLVEGPGHAASYCGVQLGPATIHLAQVETPRAGVSYKGACYLRLRTGVDEYVAQITGTGQQLTSPLKDHEYGMREATVRDLDGNDIYIGQAIEKRAEDER